MNRGGPISWWRQRRARRQAALWLARMGGTFAPERQRAFESWIAEPLNAQEFRELRAVCDVAAELKGPARVEVLESIEPAARRGAAPGLLWLSAATATAVLAAAAVGWMWLRDQGYLPRTYQTRVGQIHSVLLPDGSVAYLNTRTRLEWVGSPGDRRVRLLGGEVYFDVVHDPARPFRILLPHSEVRVLGTRFDVYQKTDGNVVVTVLSGMVAVEGLGSGPAARPSWSRRLTSDQQIEYSPVGLVADVHVASAASVIRWREGMIETRGERLSRFIGDLSRYTPERIVIADPRAAQMKIGGAFGVRDVNATLERIARIEPITVTHQDGEFILGYRSLRGSVGADP